MIKKTSSAVDDSGLKPEDILTTGLVRVWPEENPLNTSLESLINDSLRLLAARVPGSEFNPLSGLVRQLEQLLSKESDSVFRGRLAHAIKSLKAFFSSPSTESPDDNAGKTMFLVSRDKLSAFMVLVPPRGHGDMPTVNTVARDLEKAHIINGVDNKAIEQALQTVRESGDIVWRAIIATGRPPGRPVNRNIRFNVRTINKCELARDVRNISSLQPFWPPVQPETVIGVFENQGSGENGKDVFGRAVEPGFVSSDFKLSENIVCDSGGQMISKSTGHVIVDESRVEVAPVYVVNTSSSGIEDDFEFNGAVLVHGDLTGPGVVKCGSLFVTGKCEHVSVKVGGDVFVGGGIIGHNQTTIEAEGMVAASFISEARVCALGAVIVANAVISSSVISNSEILVTAPTGAIVGGHLYALRAISAAKIGSEFGMLTEAHVGRDYLTPSRLQEISEAIQKQQDNLKKLKILKQQLGKPGLSLENLASSRQELIISVLHSEQTAEKQLESLKTMREELTSVNVETSAGSVSAFDKIYPPLMVKIGDRQMEVKNDLGPIVFNSDGNEGIKTEKYNGITQAIE